MGSQGSQQPSRPPRIPEEPVAAPSAAADTAATTLQTQLQPSSWDAAPGAVQQQLPGSDAARGELPGRAQAQQPGQSQLSGAQEPGKGEGGPASSAPARPAQTAKRKRLPSPLLTGYSLSSRFLKIWETFVIQALPCQLDFHDFSEILHGNVFTSVPCTVKMAGGNYIQCDAAAPQRQRQRPMHSRVHHQARADPNPAAKTRSRPPRVRNRQRWV